jgi:O-Antigen ligase/Tetratricopeptide repeat
LRLVPAAAVALEAFLLGWAENGSIAANDWLPYAIVAALLLGTSLVAGVAGRPRTGALVGAGTLVGLAVWQTISLTWSPLPSAARDDALLTLFYAVVLVLAAITLRTGFDRAVACGLVAAAGGALAIAAALELAGGASPDLVYAGGRLVFPIDYVNTQAAAFLVSFWPAVLIGARRASPVALRAAALGAAGACLAGWLLTQSKGGAVGLAVSAVVVVAVSPARLRLLPPLAVAAVPAAAALTRLTHPYSRVAHPDYAASIRDAGWATLAVAAAAALLGLGYAFLDRHLRTDGKTVRIAGRLALVGLVLVVLAGAAGFFAAEPHPGRFAQDRWRSFKHYPTRETASSHFGSLGSNRYDFWRVALHETRLHPVAGIGDRGYQVAYLQERRSSETPARSHSLELDLLSETGVVGFALWALAAGALLGTAAARARRRALSGTAALGAATLFLAQASVDWTWSFPAVGVPVFLLLGAAAARPFPPLGRRTTLVAGIAAFVVAIVLFVPPWLSSRLTAQAYRSDSAASDLRWAKRLDPLSTAPYLAEASLASPADAIAPLEQAVEKEPRSVGLRYELALAYLRSGRRADARRELRRALKLDPGDYLVARALRRAG